MPTLHWIGKEQVINHHLEVPYKVLEHQYGFDNGKQSAEPTNSGNKIIHGDNLEALKALLPEYEGKIKCIYIDPPYNTGNEGWVYNDNVNDPRLKKWLQQVVGKEGEDLSRQDKWLCMMYPRLKLLHRLLSDSGVICISIDDNAIGYLKLICEEIFGSNKLLGSFVWKRRVGSSLSSSWVSADHEYVLVFSKNPEDAFVLGDSRDLEKYNMVDESGKKYASMPLTVGMTKEMRPNQWYPLHHPTSGNVYWPTAGRVWCYYPPTMKDKIKENKILWPEDNPERNRTTPRLKSYPEDAKREKKPLSTWIFEKNQKSKDDDEFAYNFESGKNQEGAKVIKAIFGEAVFNFSKPISLIQKLIEQFCPEDGIVLDSFAGSGTTAHAVLNLNKQDGGNRKFILIELESYAENVTSERIKKVIDGYKDDKKIIKGTGGGFDFYELGKPLFKENGNLNEQINIEEIRKYVFFTETKTTFEGIEGDENDNDYYLGKHNDTAYYFYYEPQEITTLNHDFLATVQNKAEQYVIYADNCLLTKEFLTLYNIIFKKIPRDLTHF